MNRDGGGCERGAKENVRRWEKGVRRIIRTR